MTGIDSSKMSIAERARLRLHELYRRYGYSRYKMDKFEEKYDEICLIRNEKDLKIYDFAEGRQFEPDFVLFLRVKGACDKYDNLQLFIEPKGDNLLIKDKWKNDFLKQIKTMAEITCYTQSDNFNVWGIPFFNEDNNAEFMDAMEKVLD